jgi:hypothetical protein
VAELLALGRQGTRLYCGGGSPPPSADSGNVAEAGSTTACCRLSFSALIASSLSRAAWQEVVNKMITAYKAPVSPDDAKAVVDYLVHTKGAS